MLDFTLHGWDVVVALGLSRPHLVGHSMGGMIVQMMAIEFGDRLRSMTSIMSTTGAPDLPGPRPEAAAVLVSPMPTDRASAICGEVVNIDLGLNSLNYHMQPVA